MIIKKMILHNFGVYASTNIFEFTCDKPIILIGGLNGRGKTTFLEAVLLSLYGANSFAYLESRSKSYNQYLRNYVNGSDGTQSTFLEIEFIMDTSGTELYRVRREWTSNTARTIEKIQVYKNREFNQFLTDNWIMFIENILPSGLASFFFFDGEKIAEIAIDSTSKQIKESIRSLLGITVLDLLKSDLVRIRSKISKIQAENKDIKEIEGLRIKRNEKSEELTQKDEEILAMRESLQKIEQELEKIRQEYSIKGGDIVTQKQELYQKRAQIAAKVSQGKEALINDAASELPLVLVRDMLHNIREVAEEEHEQRTMQLAIEKMDNLLEKYLADNAHNAKAIEDFISFSKGKIEKRTSSHIFNLSDSTLYQLQELLDERLIRVKIDTADRQEQQSKYFDEAEQVDNYLSVDIDEKVVSEIYKQIICLEQKKVDVELKLEKFENERRAINAQFIQLNTEFSQKVDIYLKKVETNNDAARILKYSHLAEKILEEYKIRLQKNKTKVVAETMTACYKKLANKKTLIEYIEMDPETLDLSYINKEGEAVSKNSLSAGEKQLMVVAMLWALAICSKRKLPVIIDTPLSRLDSVHRESLIKIYFPQASDQTIILSTDAEIDRHYYKMMKDSVGDEFTLLYDDSTKSTSIKRGYLFGGAQ